MDALAVLCREQDAAVLAAAVGGGLRRLHRAPCAIALLWRHQPDATTDLPPASAAILSGADTLDPDPRRAANAIALDPDLRRTGGSEHDASAALTGAGRQADPADLMGRPPAGRAARRVATSLAGRGLAARASGRVVLVELPARDGRAAQTAAERARAAAGAAPVLLVVAGPRDAWSDDAVAACGAVLVAVDGGSGDVADLAAADLVARGLRVAPVPVPRGIARPLCVRTNLTPRATRRALASVTAHLEVAA